MTQRYQAIVWSVLFICVTTVWISVVSVVNNKEESVERLKTQNCFIEYGFNQAHQEHYVIKNYCGAKE